VDTIGGSFGRGGGVYSTPAVAFGRVYLGSIDSRVYSLDMDTGEIAWSKSTGAEVYSGPVVADTKGTRATVYIGSADDNFYALDAKTGETRWQQDTGGDVTGAGSVIGDVAYVSVIGDAIGTIGYDIESGEKVWSHELGEYNPAITDGDRLYLTGYSTLRAFTPDDGKDKGGKKGKRKGGKQREDGAANTDKKNNKKQKPKQQKRQRQQKNR
jgi:outer membrane protein assembly factor BamB